MIRAGVVDSSGQARNDRQFIGRTADDRAIDVIFDGNDSSEVVGRAGASVIVRHGGSDERVLSAPETSSAIAFRNADDQLTRIIFKGDEYVVVARPQREHMQPREFQGNPLALLATLLGAANDPFIYAVRAKHGPPAMPDFDNGVWRDSAMPLDPHSVAMFVADGNALRPATVGEVAAAFDHRVAAAELPRWSALPKPDSVVLRNHGFDVELNGERLRVPFERGAFTSPSDGEVTAALAQVPFQALRNLKRLSISDRVHVAADYSYGTQAVRISTPWKGDLPDTLVHEIAGHGTERGDPAFYRSMFQAMLLDSFVGKGAMAPEYYGLTDPAEFFATLMQSYRRDDVAFAKDRPHMARFVATLFTRDGSAVHGPRG